MKTISFAFLMLSILLMGTHTHAAECVIGNGIYSRIGNESGDQVVIMNFSKKAWVKLKQKGYRKNGRPFRKNTYTLAKLNNLEMVPSLEGTSENSFDSQKYGFLHYPIHIGNHQISVTVDKEKCLPNGDCFTEKGLWGYYSSMSKVVGAFVDMLPTCDEITTNGEET